MACMEPNLTGHLKNITTEELHPIQDEFSFLKCCNERSKALLDKLNLRPVEKFLREVAQGVGATVLESNHNVINCIPLSEKGLAKNIHQLEQLLHELKTCSCKGIDQYTNTKPHSGCCMGEHLQVSPRDIFDCKKITKNCGEAFVNNSRRQVIHTNTEPSEEVKSFIENQKIQKKLVHTIEGELGKSNHKKSDLNKTDSEEISLGQNRKDLHKKKHLRFSTMRSEVDFNGYVHHNSNHKHRKKHEKTNVHKIECKQKELNSNYLLTGQQDRNYVVDSLYREQLSMKPYGIDYNHIDIDNLLIDNQEHVILSPNLTVRRKYSDLVCHDVDKIENGMKLEDNARDKNIIMPDMECCNISSNEMVRDHGDSDYNDALPQVLANSPFNPLEQYKTNIDHYGLYDIIPMKQKRKYIKHRPPRQEPSPYNPVASHHAFPPLHRKTNRKNNYTEYDYKNELSCDYTKCTMPNDIDINNCSDELEEMDRCSVINTSSLENVVKNDTKCKPQCRQHIMRRDMNKNIRLKDRSISDFYEDLYDEDVNNKIMKNVIRSYGFNKLNKKNNTKDTGICVSGSSIANHYKAVTNKRNQEVQLDEKQFMQNKMFSVGTECAFPILNEQKIERDLVSNDTSMKNPREQIMEIKHLLTSCLKELITDTKQIEASQSDMYKCCSSSKCCCTVDDSFSHTYIELPNVTCRQCNKMDECLYQDSETCQRCHQSQGKSTVSTFHDYLIANPSANNKSWKGYDCDTRRYVTKSTQLSESRKSICITNSVNNTSVKIYDEPKSQIHKEITIDGHTYILLDNANKSCKHNIKNDIKDYSSESMSRQCCGRYSKNKRTLSTNPNNIIEIEKDKYLQTDFMSTETISSTKCSVKEKLEKKISAVSKNNDTGDIHVTAVTEYLSEPHQEPIVEHYSKLNPDTTMHTGDVEKPTIESSPVASLQTPLKRLKLKPFTKKKQLGHDTNMSGEELKVKPINNIYNCIKQYFIKRYKLVTQKYTETQRECNSDHCNEQKSNMLADMGEVDLIKMRLNQRSNIVSPSINSNKVSIFDTFRFDNNTIGYKQEFPNSCYDNNCNAKHCVDTLDTNKVLNLHSQQTPQTLQNSLMNAQRTIPNDYSCKKQMPVPIYSSSAINISSNNCHGGGQSRIFLVAQKSELIFDSNLMLKQPEMGKESDISRTSGSPRSIFGKILKNFRKSRYRKCKEKILDTAYKNDNFGSTLSGNPSSRMYAYVKTPVCVMPLHRWKSYPNHTVESQHEKRSISHESAFRNSKKKRHKQKHSVKRNFFDFRSKNIKDDTACSFDSSDDSDYDLELAKKVISRRLRNRKFFSDNEVGKWKRSSTQMSKKRSKSNARKNKEIGVQAKVKYPQNSQKRSPGVKTEKTADTLRESIEKFWLSTLQTDKKPKKPFTRKNKYKSPFANPLYAMMRTMQGREPKFKIPKPRVKPII